MAKASVIWNDKIWINIENVLDEKVTQKEAGGVISKIVSCKPAYAEGFIMAAKRMVTGDCITRIVGVEILENIAFFVFKKYGISVKENIVLALKQYKDYEPNKLKNSDSIDNLIKKYNTKI
jgi:hypothetical protein